MARTFRRTKARHVKNYTHPPKFSAWRYCNCEHTDEELAEQFALFERQLMRYYSDLGTLEYQTNPVKYRKHNQSSRFRRRANQELLRFISEGRDVVLTHHHRVKVDHYYYV